MKKDTRR